MKKIFLQVLIAVFVLINFSATSAAERWYLPTEGIKLDGADKQRYIKSQMDVIFKRKPGERHPFSKFDTPDGWTYEKFEVDGAKYELLENPNAATNRVVMQLHGGGYVLPLDNGYRNLGMVQGVLADAAKIYLVDYRTAPENLYPAALEDTVKVYEKILSDGVDPQKIIVTGDSAGGNLALQLSLYLKQNKLPQPKCLILISPSATMTNDFPSRKYNAYKDLILGKGTPLYSRLDKSYYANGLKLNDPRLSPIYADLKNLPPMLIQVGSYELFLDECIELAKKAAADDVKVTLTIYPEMPHDFALLLPQLHESVNSFAEIRDFINQTF
ncbi:MAG: alpha/beta hydrolase [Selenomonadaceae bacterium]|nr:alpha/beta hydrolase [Selenomonadaceae bacterium]